MGYTIKQVAAMLNFTAYTLRYYEKVGLLPFVERDKNGNRVFNNNDIEWVMLIRCLRDTGMSVGEIKCYVDLCLEGDKTIGTRMQMILQHKAAVEQKIEQMNGCLAKINKKLGCYEDFVTGKSTDCCNPFKKG
ncbi:MerR family transcriptional regulator [Sporomusa sp.]|jgi:DNA-binding transcriptional MerR regulator|uniref:MerR family transcriptional regulator n=1 Tax=Sporomusa sp. TaxID=2078658 RepID=UPI002BD34D81|nr:MerR family transcriptional regulator [Sporomusa sp.]MDF2875709.1 putative HTH-type transcriptional regulator [Sporomusa sp.]HWR06999.1 MerR family transcriptional regulator [Sporomusa sp.]